MQIPHRGVAGVFTGVALGIGSTLVMQRALEQHLGEQSKSQARAIPAPSPLFLQENRLWERPAHPSPSWNSVTNAVTAAATNKSFRLKSEYIDTGLVRFVHKDLLPFHPMPCQQPQQHAVRVNRTPLGHVCRPADQQNCLSCKGVLTIAAEEQLDGRLQTRWNKTTVGITANRSEASLHNISATPISSSAQPKSTAAWTAVIEGALP